MNCPHIFLSWNWITEINEFSDSHGDKGSILLYFLSTPWTCCALYSAVKNIWIDWPLTFCSCSLWCKFLLYEIAKGIIFKEFTPAASIQRGILGCKLASGPWLPTWQLERWHFIKTIFCCEYGWVQTAYRSIVACVHMRCKMSVLPYKLILCLYFPPRLLVSRYIYSIYIAPCDI